MVELGLDTTELDNELRDVEGSFDGLEDASQLELQLDADDALRDLGELSDGIEGLEAESLELEVDTDDALRGVGELGDELDGLEAEALELEVDTDDALRSVDDLSDGIGELEAEPLELEVDTDEALRSVDDLSEELEDLEAEPLELDVDTDDALRSVGELGDELEDLEAEPIEIEADADEALREVGRLSDELEDLEAEPVLIEADTDEALESVGELSDELDSLEADPILIEADTDDALESVEELGESVAELEDLEPIELDVDVDAALEDVGEVQTSIDGIAAEPVQVEIAVDEEQAGGAIAAGVAGGAARSAVAASASANFLGEVVGNVAGQVASDAYGGAFARGLVRNAPAIAKAGATAGRTFVGGLSASTLAAGAGVAAVGLAAGLVFQAGFSRGVAELETQEAIERNLNAIALGFGLTEAAAASLREELQAVANQTSFSTSEVASLGARLSAIAPSLGVAFEDTDDVLLRIFDAAQFAGLGIAEISNTISALNKVSLQGKVTLETFQQVTEGLGVSGTFVAQNLTEKFGDVNAALAAGTITGADLVAAIDEIPQTLGASAEAAQTFSGIMSTLSSIIDQGFADVLRDSGLDDTLQQLFDPDLIASIADGFAAVFSVVASLVSSLVPVLGPVIEIVSELAQTIASILAPALSLVGSIVSVVVVPVLRLLQFALEPVFDFVQLIGDGFEFLADKLRGFVNTVSGFLAPLARFPGFEEIWAPGGIDGATDALEQVSSGVGDVTDSVTELAAASPVELEIDAETQAALDQIARLEQSIEELLTGDGRSVDLDLDVRLGDVDLFDGLIRSIQTGGDEAAAEVALGVTRIAEEYDAALAGIDSAESLADRLAAQLDAAEIERRLAQLIPQLQGAGLTEENVRQLINEFGGSPEQINAATDLVVQAYAGARDRIASTFDSGMDQFRRSNLGLGGNEGGLLDPVIGNLEAGEAELIAVQQRLASSFGVLPETGYGFPDDAVDSLSGRVDLVVAGFGDLEETAAEVVDALGDLDLAEPLALDAAETRELVRAYDQGGVAGGRAFVDGIAESVQRRDTLSTFRLDGLEGAADLALTRVGRVERAAAAVGLSGARITQGGITFTTTINVTGEQSVRTIDRLVRAAGDPSPTTRQRSRSQGGNQFE